MDDLKLTILQLNDSHAYLDIHQEIFWESQGPAYRLAGGYARIAAVVNQARRENPGQVLFCDCGDTLHGTYPAVHTQGKALIPIMNALRPAASTAHWEFAYTPPVFEEETLRLDYPMLANNIFDQKTGSRVFPASTVIEVAGYRVGLIGIASNIVDKTMPPSFSQGLRFTLGRDELPGEVEHLRGSEKVDLVILISHLGFPQDMKLLSEVQGVDVCLSAHTHNRLYHPAIQGKTIVIQSGCHGSFLGKLELTMENKKISSYDHQLVEITQEIEPDPEVAGLVSEALLPYQDKLSEVVGETLSPLHRATTLESPMDNLILHSIQETAGTQLAFSNGWRYGAPVTPGPITLDDLYNMVPMDPPITTIDLTGQELREMLEENLEHTFSRDPYQQMGGYVKRCLGMKATIRVENPPGQRIQQLFVGKEAVQPERIYSAGFITVQGVPQKYGHNRTEHPEHIISAMRDYLQQHNPLQIETLRTFTLI